jgi:hypothetical protein
MYAVNKTECKKLTKEFYGKYPYLIEEDATGK